MKRQIVVDDINNGVLINDLYTQWDSIKTNSHYTLWVNKCKEVNNNIGVSVNIIDLLETFNYSNAKINQVLKRDFPIEIKRALSQK